MLFHCITGELSEIESLYKKKEVTTKKRKIKIEVEPDGTTTFKLIHTVFNGYIAGKVSAQNKKKKSNHAVKMANMNACNSAAKEIFRHNIEVEQLKSELESMKKKLAEVDK